MIFEIVQQNYTGVLITVFLILFIVTNSNFDRKTNRLFFTAAMCVLILIIEEEWEFQLGKKETYQPLRLYLSAIGYTLRPMVPYFLVLIFQRMKLKTAMIFGIPLVINFLAAFSSLFCGISFGYNANNEFVRGPIGYLPFVVAFGYVVILLILTMKERRRGGMMEAMIVSAIVIAAFASTVLESVFHFRAIQNPSIGASIAFYYLFLHTNRNNRDELTGALTRRRFYLDAEKYRHILSAVISLDINDLKYINDHYGHQEGDKALTSVTDLIKKYMGTNASLYRNGGDEFMILCYKMDNDKVEALINKIRKELENTPYRCAIGYSGYHSGDELERACKEADQAMYENKRAMKSDKAKPIVILNE